LTVQKTLKPLIHTTVNACPQTDKIKRDIGGDNL
jgi:hypothetical protein